MNCHDTERMLELRAAELLGPEEAASLEAHLAGCEACRAQDASLDALLASAQLPPLTAVEESRLDELARLRPLRSPARPPVLRWVATAAAIAASAVLGLRLGSVTPPRPHGVTPAGLSAKAAPVRPASVRSGTSGGGDWTDVGSNFDATPESDNTDTALYDAVVFQGGVMPFDVDNG